MQSSEQSLDSLAISPPSIILDKMCSAAEKSERRTAKNLLNVSIDEKREFLDSFDYILADCDGE